MNLKKLKVLVFDILFSFHFFLHVANVPILDLVEAYENHFSITDQAKLLKLNEQSTEKLPMSFSICYQPFLLFILFGQTFNIAIFQMS